MKSESKNNVECVTNCFSVLSCVVSFILFILFIIVYMLLPSVSSFIDRIINDIKINNAEINDANVVIRLLLYIVGAISSSIASSFVKMIILDSILIFVLHIVSIFNSSLRFKSIINIMVLMLITISYFNNILCIVFAPIVIFDLISLLFHLISYIKDFLYKIKA